MTDEWYVYVVECADRSLYCGITTNLVRRLHEHNNTKKGAKYTKSRRPVKFVFTSQVMTRSLAASTEAKFKRLSAKKKREIIKSHDTFNCHFVINDNTHTTETF